VFGTIGAALHYLADLQHPSIYWVYLSACFAYRKDTEMRSDSERAVSLQSTVIYILKIVVWLREATVSWRYVIMYATASGYLLATNIVHPDIRSLTHSHLWIAPQPHHH
jgi:hypothetical protein